MKADLNSLVVFIVLVGVSTAAAAEINIEGSFNCSELTEQFRKGAIPITVSGIVGRLTISNVTSGSGELSRSSPWRGDRTQTIEESWSITISPSYAIELVGENHRGTLDRGKFSLKGQAPNGNVTNGQLTGALLGGKTFSDIARTCSYTFNVRGGTLADARMTAAELKLAQQQKDMERDKAIIATEKERLAAQTRQVDSGKAMIEEEGKSLAEQQARIANDKKQAAEKERMAALESKQSAELAQQKKVKQEHNEAARRRVAEQTRLAANQQDIQRRQAATDQRVGNVEAVLSNIALPRGERASEWILRAPSIPVQQQQFCRVIEKFHDDLDGVYRTRNEIKKNALYKDRQQDVAALLPNGMFENWLLRLVEVTQAKDGSAAVMLQLPCRAMLGSDSCAKDSSKPQATISANSAAYRELQRMDSGNFVVVSGRVLFAATDAGTKALPSYATYQPGTHCAGAEGGKQQDVFTVDIRYLVQLR